MELLASLEFQCATGLVDFDADTFDRAIGSVRYQLNGFFAPPAASSALLRAGRVATVDMATGLLTFVAAAI